MFRFTIRDVLWLMVVVGFAIAWRFDAARTWNRERATIMSEMEALKSSHRRLVRDIEREGFHVELRSNGRLMKLPSTQKD